MTEIEKYLEDPSNVSEGLRLYNQYGKHAALKRNAAKKPAQYHSKVCYELGKIKHLGRQVEEKAVKVDTSKKKAVQKPKQGVKTRVIQNLKRLIKTKKS